MGNRKERIVRFGKQNKWFRCCLIDAYTVVYTLPALRKKYLSFRMEFTACLIAAALCVSQIFAVTVSAEEMAEAAGNQTTESRNGDTVLEDAGTEGGADDAGTSADTKDDPKGSSADGTGDMEKEKIPSSPEDDADNAADSEDPVADSGDVSGNDPVKDSDDVSGNDPAAGSDDMRGNDPAAGFDDVRENDPAAAPEDISGNDPEETQYPYIPQLFIDCHMTESAAGILVGNASSVLVLSTIPSYLDPETEDGFGMSPAVCAYGYADGEMLYADLQTGTAEVSLPDNFYGSIVFTAKDAEGNTCEVSTPMFLVDASAPDICIMETELTDGSRQAEAVLKEEGAAATGIAQVSCLVNGEGVPVEYDVTGIFENCYGQAVISEASYSLPLKESGCYSVRLEVQDHAGNVSSYVQEIEIPEKRGPVCVTAPSRVTLTIDPWTGDEQIFSDNFTIKNGSGYDIIATLQSAKVTVNRENAGGDPARKDCGLNLSSDLLGDIYLPEGDSDELLSVRIPAKKEDGKTNGSLSMRVHGNLSEGSEPLWKDEDIKLELYFDYKAAPER